MENSNKPSILKLNDGNYLAYHKYTSGGRNNLPGIVFLGGYNSDMNGSKAMFLDTYCRKNDISFIRFDYLGHGQSSGEFNDFTLGDWKNNASTVISQLTSNPQILIGSSMGSWISLLLVLEKPQIASHLIGIACAADFTEDLVWKNLSPQERKNAEQTGFHKIYDDECNDPDTKAQPFIVSYKMITEARNHLIFNKEKLNINCPVRLIHGMQDKDVPYQRSVKIMEKINSYDVRVILSKTGGHRMSAPEDLQLLQDVLEEVLRDYMSFQKRD